jgi:rhodanese-related sulfurtransferase
MRTHLLAVVLALAPVAACSKSDQGSSERAAAIEEVSVDELDKLLSSNACQAVDANGDGTRKKLGVIPGAVLLTDSDTFNPRELPTDKTRPLVFYCANKSCGASHEAAGKARTAGYKDVKVLPEGIAGWVKAGKQVTSI